MAQKIIPVPAGTKITGLTRSSDNSTYWRDPITPKTHTSPFSSPCVPFEIKWEEDMELVCDDADVITDSASVTYLGGRPRRAV